MMPAIHCHNWRNGLAAVAVLALLSACSLPGAKKAVSERVWMLEDSAAIAAVGAADCTVRISHARAAPGFNTTRMLYQRSPSRLEYFAWQSWADTPPAMLTALVASRLERSGAVVAAVLGTTDVATDARLDLDAVQVLQVFDSSRSYMQLELRAQLLALPARDLLGVQRFSYRVPAESATPDSGVAAANIATGRLLKDLQDFVTTALSGLPCSNPAAEVGME